MISYFYNKFKQNKTAIKKEFLLCEKFFLFFID